MDGDAIGVVARHEYRSENDLLELAQAVHHLIYMVGIMASGCQVGR
jgi:hypothetical protein